MYKFRILICVVFLICSVFLTEVSAAVCSIESSPIDELVQYQRTVDARIAELTTLWQAAWSCGISSGGASSSIERTSQVVESAYVGVAYMPDLLLDFSYNIQIAARGDTRVPVLRDGEIFISVNNRITRAISTLANRCNLSDEVQSGFSSLLRENRTLENIYKRAALWTPDTVYAGLSESGKRIAEAINHPETWYLPTATEACRDQTGTADPLARIMASIESIGTKNESVWTDWKKWIALFQWGGGTMSTTEYNNRQRKLLSSYLEQSGYTSRMTQTMLGNFDCTKSKSLGSSDAASLVTAQKICLQNPILGLDTILLPWKQAVNTAKDTNEKVEKESEYNKKRDTKTAVLKMYSDISVYQSSAIETKSALITNLIDLHIALVSTSGLVEKRLQAMYQNCMKWQPMIPCPRP